MLLVLAGQMPERARFRLRRSNAQLMVFQTPVYSAFAAKALSSENGDFSASIPLLQFIMQ